MVHLKRSEQGKGMNTQIIETKLKQAGILYKTEQGFSGFTYTRLIFKGRNTAIQAEKATGEQATKHFHDWGMTFY